MLWTVIINWKIQKKWTNSRCIWPIKIEPRNHLNRSITSKEIEAVIESPNKEKSRTEWIHCWILPDLKKKNQHQTIP
jgi:hypothetical protein